MRVSSTSAQCAGRSPAPGGGTPGPPAPTSAARCPGGWPGARGCRGSLGRAALLVVQLVGRAPRELARQQDRHHAQVADDRQQQPAQPSLLRPASRPACSAHTGSAASWPSSRPITAVLWLPSGSCSGWPGRSNNNAATTAPSSARQRIEGIAQHRPGGTHLVVAIRRFPMLAQGLAQRAGSTAAEGRFNKASRPGTEARFTASSRQDRGLLH